MNALLLSYFFSEDGDAQTREKLLDAICNQQSKGTLVDLVSYDPSGNRTNLVSINPMSIGSIFDVSLSYTATNNPISFALSHATLDIGRLKLRAKFSNRSLIQANNFSVD